MTPATLLDQPRALGTARVESKGRAGRSCIADLHMAGALKLLFPRSSGPLHVVAINSAGGITGGDRFDLTAEAGAESTLVLTTQAAERAYRAQPGQTGKVTTRLSVRAGASLRWLPQETILYECAALSRRLEVDLELDARFLMVEPVIFGRTAMGEEARGLRFRDRIRIHRAGQPIYADGVDLMGDVPAQLDRPAVGDGARAMANLVCVAPEAEAHLGTVRQMAGPLAGASLLGPDILVMRMLARDGFDLRRHLVPILEYLTDNDLPASWRL
ncbi:urease accessory protein UreD [uncultured Roseobacter sp.]|uniref:urease accessory protein UreD n=1 Tax=uncultured Roseobacter sp. TaxID=114847 RepID=UPI0026336439|nr:urease accessory protein UreD [uncultured Roseobacter sp.]